mgnify:CR=1 FL=1
MSRERISDFLNPEVMIEISPDIRYNPSCAFRRPARGGRAPGSRSEKICLKNDTAKDRSDMKWSREKSLTVVYFALYLMATLTIALHQPLNDTYPLLQNPPDEHSRYKVPLYICEHGTLPTGYEEELFSGECRWTYGFYTLLPYMTQGYAMRFAALFTDSELALLYTARLVNVIQGLIMAYVILLLGKRLFEDDRVKWLFCFLVTFLPQSLFMHTYVNPDSMCLLSTALMFYGLVAGMQDGFSFRPCVLLTAGIILCALSYYNGYGFILGSMVLFVACFIRKEGGKLRYDWKPFLKKGIIISAAVLLCIGWHFVRNYMLYDGDFIGLTSKENLIRSYGISRDTYYSEGKSLFSMLFGTTFFLKVALSFIANYGSTTLYAWKIVYLFYLGVFALGIGGAFFGRSTGQEPWREKTWLRLFFHAAMTLCIVIPFILLVRYAYATDYQAQGRYLMPGLIPFLYYVARGLEKLPLWRKGGERRKNILWLCSMAGIAASLLIMVYVVALPRYLEVTVL